MKNTTTSAGAVDPAASVAEHPPLVYEPPAVAWEEPFEPIAATTCGIYPGDGCKGGGIHPVT